MQVRSNLISKVTERDKSEDGCENGSLTETGYTANDLALCSTPEGRATLSLDTALRFRVLPLALLKTRGTTTLHLVTSTPTEALRREVQFACGYTVDLSEAPAALVEEATLRAYLGSEEALARRLRDLAPTPGVERGHNAYGVDLTGAQGDAAHFLTALLQHAAVRGASDLHLCPIEHGAITKMRLDGDLLIQDEQPYPKRVHEQMVNRLKVLAGLDTSKKHIPQDGSFAFQVGAKNIHVRLSTIPAVYGESVAIRFLLQKQLPDIASLGLHEIVKGWLVEQLGKRAGLVLLTGPTGSGKSTTLYASLREVQRRGANAITVEDPVELTIPGAVQVQVNVGQGLDYPTAIRSVLRHDPDAILIGEMRDPVSAQIAIEAALTGHIALSSLHCASALDVVARLVSLGVTGGRAAEALLLVMNQRLLPRLCERCKVADLSGSRHFRATLYQGAGCPACAHSGYYGRVLVTECLRATAPGVRKLLTAGHDRAELLTVLGEDSFSPWSASLQHLLLKGYISVGQFGSFLDTELADC